MVIRTTEDRQGGVMRYYLSHTEIEIMEFLWERGCPITTRELEAHFNTVHGKGWKRSTLNTHLSRLAIKEAITREKNIIKACPKSIFEQNRCKELLDYYYDGSMQNMYAVLSGRDITDEEKDAIENLSDSILKKEKK